MPVQPCPSDIMLDVADLTVMARGRSKPVLSHIGLRVRRGEVLGIVGESGGGKSTLALALMGAVKPGLEAVSGQVRVAGVGMLSVDVRTLRGLRGRVIAHVSQNAGLALTPTMRVGLLLDEALSRHGHLTPSARRRRALDLLADLSLANVGEIASRYPFQLSGGQQQRCAIALALACAPTVLVLDEPTSGLDATAHGELLALLRRLAKERDLTIVCISHDMRVAARLCSRVAVMYAGRIVEEGSTDDVLGSPRHPYTQGLIRSSPRLDAAQLPPALPPGDRTRNGARGCAFASRCSVAIECCGASDPPRVALPGGASILCHRASELPASSATDNVAQRVKDLDDGDPVLIAADLMVRYAARRSWLALVGGRPSPLPAVDGVSLAARRGSVLGIIGESGSGKSTLLKALAGAVPVAAGEMTLNGERLESGLHARPLELRRRIQLVWQNPMTALNPRQTVRETLAAPLRLYRGLSRAQIEERAAELLDAVRLGPGHLDRLPRQLSGGEAQRVAIARALAAEPDVLLCDEITSALDVSVQAAVLALIDDVRRRTGITVLFVTHDLAVVRAIADDVMVLRGGRLCEAGRADEVFARPQHPHTRALIDAFAEGVPARQPIGPPDRIPAALAS